jgi:copper homeostasis protein
VSYRVHRVSRFILEVIVQSVADAREAARGGADRLEIVREISVGGLTPPLSLVRAIANETALPLRVMVRENAGFGATTSEIEAMRDTAAALAGIGVDGLVVGFTTESGELGIDALRSILSAAPATRATFHRAFDALADPFAAIDALRDVAQVDRILTSGGNGSDQERCARLRAGTNRADGRLTLVAGGGVTAAMIEVIASTRCVTEVHVGRAARDDVDATSPVRSESVRRLREQLDRGGERRGAPTPVFSPPPRHARR